MPGKAPIKHAPVARFKPVVAELEAAQPVAFKRVGAGQVNHKAGLKAAGHLVQRNFQRVQVVGIAAAIRQIHVQIARLLAMRKILFAVQ